MKKTLLVVLGVLALAAIGCETTRGVGKDMENTGSNIQQGVGNVEGSNQTDTQNR